MAKTSKHGENPRLGEARVGVESLTKDGAEVRSGYKDAAEVESFGDGSLALSQELLKDSLASHNHTPSFKVLLDELDRRPWPPLLHLSKPKPDKLK